MPSLNELKEMIECMEDLKYKIGRLNRSYSELPKARTFHFGVDGCPVIIDDSLRELLDTYFRATIDRYKDSLKEMEDLKFIDKNLIQHPSKIDDIKDYEFIIQPDEIENYQRSCFID